MLRRLGSLEGECGRREVAMEEQEPVRQGHVHTESAAAPAGAPAAAASAAEGGVRGHSGVILFVVPFISLAEVSPGSGCMSNSLLTIFAFVGLIVLKPIHV
jgi:hypothetical protein